MLANAENIYERYLCLEKGNSWIASDDPMHLLYDWAIFIGLHILHLTHPTHFIMNLGALKDPVLSIYLPIELLQK